MISKIFAREDQEERRAMLIYARYRAYFRFRLMKADASAVVGYYRSATGRARARPRHHQNEASRILLLISRGFLR